VTDVAPTELQDLNYIAEQSALGAALLDAAVVERSHAVGLIAADFVGPGHGAIWAAMSDLIERDGTFDVTTVFEALQARGQDELAGGLKYLNDLAQSVPSARNVEVYVRRVRAAALRRAAVEAAERLAADLRRSTTDLGEAVRAGVDELHQLAEAVAGRTRAFVSVPVADVMDAQPPAPSFWWGNLVPAGAITLWSGHGGSAKSYVCLMLACAMALGRPLFGEATRRGRVAYYSAEDPASVVRYRLHVICRAWGVDPAELDKWLIVLDATRADPVLFRESQAGGIRFAAPTQAYGDLRAHLVAEGIEVLVVDNASDAYDASEIDRAKVRAFMRALVRLVPEHGAVVLLCHVDKASARGDRGTGEAYSGSTAWHNSARSRIAQSRDKGSGDIVLEHQKGNHCDGPLHAVIRLTWPSGGVPDLDKPVEGVVKRIAEENDARALLRLVHEFTERGEYVTTATTSRTHAAKLLKGERTYPRALADREVFDLLRQAERRGWLAREEVRGPNRHPRQVWKVTPAGAARAAIHLAAPTAPTARTSDVDAPGAESAEACADCADFGARGVGGNARAEVGAPGAADEP
jgi:hypothetical protein